MINDIWHISRCTYFWSGDSRSSRSWRRKNIISSCCIWKFLVHIKCLGWHSPGYFNQDSWLCGWIINQIILGGLLTKNIIHLTKWSFHRMYTSISSFKNNLYSPYFSKLESTFVWRQSNAHLEDLLAIPKLMRGLGTSVKKCPN